MDPHSDVAGTDKSGPYPGVLGSADKLLGRWWRTGWQYFTAVSNCMDN